MIFSFVFPFGLNTEGTAKALPQFKFNRAGGHYCCVNTIEIRKKIIIIISTNIL